MANSGKGKGTWTYVSPGKERVGRSRQLEACRQELAQARQLLVEAAKQQTATSELLRIISFPSGNEGREAERQPGFTAQLQATLNVIPAFAWYAAASGGLTFVNKRTADYLGLPDDHPLRIGIDIGAQWDAHIPLLHPDDREESRKAWSTCLRTGEAAEFSLRVRSARGDYRWFLSRAEPLRASDGTLLQWVGVNLDIEELKCTEQALRESEYKLRQIIETVPGLIWSTAPDGEPTHLNQRMLDYSGMQFEDYLHGGWQALLHPADFPETAKAFHHAIQTGTSYQTVHRLRRADGEFRWYHVRGEPLRDQQGRIIQWYGLSVDIDEAKKAEDRLRRSEAHLAEAQRLSHTGASTYNATTILYWSEETYRIFGFDPRDGLPSREAVWQRIHPDDRNRVREEVEHAQNGRGGFSSEFRIVLPDGTLKYIESIRQPVFSTNGELVEVVATQIDVTERKRAEEALRDSEYKLRQIIETVPGHIWSTDPDGEPTHINQRLLDYSGMRFEDFKQRGWEVFVHPDDFPETAKAFHHAIQTGTSYQTVHRLRRADGEFRWYHVRGEPLRDQQGRIIQWYGLSVDIDDAKKAEDRLRRSEAYLAEAQRLSHTGNWVYDATTMHYLYWSDEGYRIWGFDPLQGIPSRENMWERIHPDDRDKVRGGVQEALRQKRNFAGEFRILLPDGTVKFLEATSDHKFSPLGELLEAMITHVDVTERKRAEQALRESEAKIRRLVDANIIGIFIWDFDGRVLEANEAFLRIVGYDHEDLVAGHIRWTDLTPPEWQDRDAQLIQEHMATGTLQPFEKEYFRKDGSRVPVLIGVATFEEGGNQGVAFVLDLTNRKRAEGALRESEGKFRDYAETASDWFWEIGPDYKFTLLTENAFGSNSAGRIGTTWGDHALDLETEPEKWRLVWATLDSRKQFRDFIYRGLDGNGSPMYVKASGKPMFDAKGEFRGYRGTGTDVTAIMRAQEALRESERSSRSAIDGIAGLVSVLSASGELEAVNRQVFEYFGQPLEWLKNWGTNNAVHPEDLPRVLELMKRGIASGIPFNFELRLRRFDGEYRWFDNRSVPIRDDSGRIARWYVLLTDIEDRTRALARLEQMQSDFAHMNRVSMMGELAASLSHEITQPIASARNNARAAQNFLDMEPPDLSEVREALSCVVDDTDRAGDIVDRIRDHIKKAPPRKGHFDLNAAMSEVLVLARNTITKNGVSVRTQLADGLFPVCGDRVQLQQVVLNLILNAVEAMGSRETGARELSIRTEQDQTGVLVAVRDFGPGIDPSHLERVFDAFYTTKSSGTGMGLSICRSIIDAHGGRLWAEANEPSGAVFQFTLPSAEGELMTSLQEVHQT